jgi:hypothetical protein
MYPLLMEGRLKFANYCFKDPKTGAPNLEVMYSEFEKCLTSHHHDDIPDVISMQLRYQPRAYLAIAENNEAMLTRSDPMWNMIFEDGDQFGRRGYGLPEPSFNPAEEDIQEDGDPIQYWQF